MAWQTRRIAAEHDVRAPDGSEIRLLVRVDAGSMVHCSLQPGDVTRAVRHRTVEEMWFCVSGAGQVWRKAQGEAQLDEIVDVEPGVALSIPVGVAFQFRARGARPLEVVIATLPAWPGEDEAVPVDGAWQATR
ncbi:MAG: cupin domain-containing protein [Chloroflexota bacterium]|nr:cupin domain-containing protein [Chloroflexota bacterium]